MASKITYMPEFVRSQERELASRLAEPRRFIQVVSGPRQVGKTTLVRQVVSKSGIPYRYASADEPGLRARGWIDEQWQVAREQARAKGRKGMILVLDEIQKVPGWSSAVKRLWDEDSAGDGPRLKIVVLGSAPLLLAHGLGESLAGRFETLHLPHWSFAEMRDAFGWSLDQYLFFGSYPGAAPLVREPERWARYVVDALIETTISRDVLLLTRVDRPALLRRLFELGSRMSGQIVSYTKMLGQLQDTGNVTTLAHYLDLLAGAGMVTGLQKYAGGAVRSRGSIPKLQVLNTALTTAQSGRTLAETKADREAWGRLTESAVGAHLANAAATGECEVFYWRDRNREVDFVVRSGPRLAAIEVKSGRPRDSFPGLAAFSDLFNPKRALLVGSGGIPVDEFLLQPVRHWLAG